MSQRAVELCIGRLITDAQFCHLASTSLLHACRQFGFELTSTEIELLGQLDFSSLADVSRHLNPGLQRSGTHVER